MDYKNEQNELQFRRFLLGGMAEEERSDFEEQFILDQELFENLRVAEDELIEEYVRGTLKENDKTKFEANFVTTQNRRERVEFTRQMLSKLKEVGTVAEVKKTASVAENLSFFESVLAFFKQPKFAFGTAFAILLLILGGWFFLRKPNQPIDVAKDKTPLPTPSISVTPTPQADENKNIGNVSSPVNTTNRNSNLNNQQPKNESNANKKPENTNQEKQIEPLTNPVVVTLALFTGGVRSEGKTNQLNLPKNSRGANLQLNLESQDYKNYRAEIVDQNGSVIYRSGVLKAQNSKVNAFVSAQKLKSGDYIIKLYGKNAQNQDESVADYQFRVNFK